MASPATDFAPALPVGLEDVQAAAMRIEVVRAWRGGHCARVVDLHEGATLGE